MRRTLMLLACIVVAVAGLLACLAWVVLRPPTPEWTTRSSKAREVFELGLLELTRLYQIDAIRHFEHALELDPGFVMAKLQLAALSPSRSERQRLTDELRQAATDELTERERFLVAYQLARVDRRDTDAETLLADFLARHPSDLYGLRTRCRIAWNEQRWSEAEACIRNLLEIHPNWVEGRNNLGFIAMARGRFDEAEDHFRTYRYVAPDQANPIYSLAVLHTIRGRYEEAEDELAEVVRIKPDFCMAYTQWVEIGFMSGRLAIAEKALADLESVAGCETLDNMGLPCALHAWVRYLGGDADGAWELLQGGCLERRDGFDLLAHRIAVMTGRFDEGATMEKVLRKYRDKVAKAGRPVHAQFLTALLAHLQGIRALAEEDFDGAVELLAAADEDLAYWGGERASIKLFNRLNWLRALELKGLTRQAIGLRAEIDEVNPRLIDDFPLPDLDAFGQIGDTGITATFPLREDQNQ